MERCKNCNKFTGTPGSVSVGEKCTFAVANRKGRTTKIRVCTGTLLNAFAEGGFSVLYRNKEYRTPQVVSLKDPSFLTLAFIGRCRCPDATED